MQQKYRTFIATLAVTFAVGAAAQDNTVLKAAAQKAISTSPEVTARFNAYRAAADAIDAARGAYLPRLDLNASVGRDRDKFDGRTPETQSLSRRGASLTLRQVLWDGLATRNEVGRLNHEQLARYFELLDATEQTSLEAARAYYDVLRYRRLVQLAEDNYVQHKSAFNQIQSRFKAGVGRGVDLEQAGARLALAESNLTTEVSNLHDVSARYQRVIGDVPPQQMPLPAAFNRDVPSSAAQAALDAVQRSPSVSAAIETMRATRALVGAREAAYQPTLQARLRSGVGRNFDGVRDQRADTSAELVLNWNLFNGGSDQARVRQQVNLVNQAADQRDKACRDARQVLAIAYNDTRKLTDQLVLLDRNTLAIEKARDAYRQQFDIGQRSLLDLLNSENELYTARRSYANAEFDLGIAYVRTQASLHRLSALLGITRGDERPSGVDGWTAGDDGPARCPADAVETHPINLDALNQRAVSQTAPPPPPATPAAPAKPAVNTSAVTQRLTEWAAAWEDKNVSRYLSFYSEDFRPSKGSLAGWKAQRRQLVGKPGQIIVKLDKVEAREIAPGRVQTAFIQSYHSDNFSDVTSKSITWQKVGESWLITEETSLPPATSPTYARENPPHVR